MLGGGGGCVVILAGKFLHPPVLDYWLLPEVNKSLKVHNVFPKVTFPLWLHPVKIWLHTVRR